MTPAQKGAVFAAARSLLGLSQQALAELVSAVSMDISDLEAGVDLADLQGRVVVLFSTLGLTIECDDEGVTLRVLSEAPLSAAMALAVIRQDALSAALLPSRRFVDEIGTTKGEARRVARTAARVSVVKAFEIFRDGRSDRAALDDFVALLRGQVGLHPSRRTLERWLSLYRRKGQAGLISRWGGGPAAMQTHLL